MKTFLKEFLNSLLAGICVGIGGTVYLSADNKYLGALLFCIGLVSICYMNLSLYTGKIGFMVFSYKKSDFIKLFACLIGNISAMILMGRLIAITMPQLSIIAKESCENKLLLPIHSVLIRGFMCGILMYIAVWVFQKKNSTIGMFLAIPTFVIAEFEHSIADMFYFSLAGIYDENAIIFIVIVLLGNTIGSLAFAALQNMHCMMEDNN